MVPEQGPGIQVTFGAVRTFRFENVSIPEQPLKLYPTAIDVRVSFEDTTKVIAVPCTVVPLHWPAASDEADVDGAPGPPLQADAKYPASVPTQNTAFIRAHAAATPPATPVCVRIGPVLRVCFVRLTSSLPIHGSSPCTNTGLSDTPCDPALPTDSAQGPLPISGYTDQPTRITAAHHGARSAARCPPRQADCAPRAPLGSARACTTVVLTSRCPKSS